MDTRYNPGKKPKSHESVPVCSWEDNYALDQGELGGQLRGFYFYCIVRIIEYAQGRKVEPEYDRPRRADSCGELLVT